MAYRGMMTGVALSALLCGAAVAQDRDRDGDEEQAFAPDCVALFEFVEAAPGLNLDDEPDLVRIIERNSGVLCRRELAALREEAAPAARAERTARQAAPVARAAEVASETETVRQRVQLEEVVTVVGDVDVAVPAPTVEVRQRPAEVRVTPAAPTVSVRTGRPEIVVREQPATVTVGMPTITIQQPAPEITITLPPHDVSVDAPEPRVEISQADPVIRVSVPEPRVDLDLRAVTGETAGGVNTRVRRNGSPAVARDGLRVVDGGTDAVVYVQDAEAQLALADTTGEPRVQVEEAGEPRVRVERAEPRIEMDGEPEVRFERVGEPTVRVVQGGASEGAQRRQGAAALTRDAEEADDREERARPARAERRARREADRAADATSAAGGLTVADLKGREVVGAEGETLGEITRFVRSGGTVYAVVSSGGFFGIGDREAPLALSDLRLRGEEIAAPGLTEERIDAIRDADISDRLNLEDDEAVRLRTE